MGTGIGKNIYNYLNSNYDNMKKSQQETKQPQEQEKTEQKPSESSEKSEQKLTNSLYIYAAYNEALVNMSSSETTSTTESTGSTESTSSTSSSESTGTTGSTESTGSTGSTEETSSTESSESTGSTSTTIITDPEEETQMPENLFPDQEFPIDVNLPIEIDDPEEPDDTEEPDESDNEDGGIYIPSDPEEVTNPDDAAPEYNFEPVTPQPPTENGGNDNDNDNDYFGGENSKEPNRPGDTDNNGKTEPDSGLPGTTPTPTITPTPEITPDKKRYNVKDLSISDNGVNFIIMHETYGGKVEMNAYYCEAGKLTIGYGHSGTIDPKKYLAPPNNTGGPRPLREGDTLKSEAAAMELMKEDLKAKEKILKTNVKVPLTQNEYDALVSLIYSTYPSIFTNSKLLKKINAGKYEAAAVEFDDWDKVRINGELKRVPGLTNRRWDEKALYLS